MVDPETDPSWPWEYGKSFHAENVLHDECEQSPANYWHSVGGARDQAFVLDYGCTINMAGLKVRNAYNVHYRDRQE